MGRLCELSALVAILFVIPVREGWGIQRICGQTGSRPRTWRVPALYIFGDSLADSGNNNDLPTIARSNFPPYGREFDTRHATGRFSDGKMTSDWITEFLHLPLVPPYLSQEARMYWSQGANFASAGAGILNRTGNVLGMKISGWEQIDFFLEKRNDLIARLGEEATSRHLRDSVYYIALGGNDYIHNWITNDTDAALLPHDEFNNLLISTFEDQLQVLYNAGPRKIAVLGIGPVGCAPHFLWLSNTTTGECMETVNQYVSEFNDGVRALLVRFNQQNPGAHAVYRDTWNIVYRLSKFPSDYGFMVGDTACCGVENYGGGGPCRNPLMVCDDPPSFVWWDLYHPSHRANRFIAKQVFSGADLSTTTTNFTSNATYSFLTLEELASLQLGED